MNKTIAIIELYQHDEVLHHYCDLLSDNDYNIKVFCSKVVYENLIQFKNFNKFDWFVKEEDQSIPVFLKTHQVTFQSSDMVFITTALSHFKAFYKLSKTAKTLLLVHNAHSFLSPKSNLSFNPKKPLTDRLRWLKVKFNRSHFYKKQMLSTLQGLAFPTETILNYVQKKYELPPNLKLISLPFVYFQNKKRIQHEKIVITIPCTVSSDLRDYGAVLKTFQHLKNSVTIKIQLVFLGKPKGDGQVILRDFKNLEGNNLEVISFKYFLPLIEYEHWLRSSDFLILPLKKYGRNYIYKERLGFSKISGSVNDMIRFGIPALITDTYPLEDYLTPMTTNYINADDLTKKSLDWIKNKVYLSKKNNVDACLSIYSREKIKQQIKEIFHHLLNS